MKKTMVEHGLAMCLTDADGNEMETLISAMVNNALSKRGKRTMDICDFDEAAAIVQCLHDDECFVSYHEGSPMLFYSMDGRVRSPHKMFEVWAKDQNAGTIEDLIKEFRAYFSPDVDRPAEWWKAHIGYFSCCV